MRRGGCIGIEWDKGKHGTGLFPLAYNIHTVFIIVYFGQHCFQLVWIKYHNVQYELHVSRRVYLKINYVHPRM